MMCGMVFVTTVGSWMEMSDIQILIMQLLFLGDNVIPQIFDRKVWLFDNVLPASAKHTLRQTEAACRFGTL